MLAINRFLMPDDKIREIDDEQAMEKNQTRTRKAVSMVKSITRELAKAAPITVLFHTVGLDALSL